MISEDHLLYWVEDHVANIRINREQQRNAVTPEAIVLFLEYLDMCAGDHMSTTIDGDSPIGLACGKSNRQLKAVEPSSASAMTSS